MKKIFLSFILIISFVILFAQNNAFAQNDAKDGVLKYILEKLDRLEKEHQALKTKVENLENENISLKQKIQEAINNYNTIVNKFTNENTALKNKVASLEQQKEPEAPKFIKFMISIMSAEDVRVEWRPKEKIMTEEALIKRGVDVTKMKEAIAKIYSALALCDPKDVILLPDEPSDAMPGPAYRISSLGINNKYYDNFHIYQKDSVITVTLYMGGSSISRISPDDVEIDWELFKDGFSSALTTLYSNEFTVEFGKLRTSKYSYSSWEYAIPFLLRPKNNPNKTNPVDEKKVEDD